MIMDNNKTIYVLNVEDVQTVAEEVLERPLTDSEIKIVEDKIGDKINWYSAIEYTIIEWIGPYAS
jgi:hypothetical protein